ncbi:MAG: preprotein translocase subunit SecE [Clostridia bacterium]|nr:preprotein translocase subunit SecE [Clostridia bacterium]
MEEEKNVVAADPNLDNTAAQENAKKPVKVEKTDKKKAKKEKKPSKVGKMFKETGSELKKVTWPTFKETVKRTGVVLAVVIFFGVVLLAFDFVLSVLYKLLIKATITAVEKWVAVGLSAAIVVAAVVIICLWISKKKKAGRR